MVSFEEGEKFAKENDMIFLETSAKTSENVEEVIIIIFFQSKIKIKPRTSFFFKYFLTMGCMMIGVYENCANNLHKNN